MTEVPKPGVSPEKAQPEEERVVVVSAGHEVGEDGFVRGMIDTRVLTGEQAKKHKERQEEEREAFYRKCDELGIPRPDW